jgi:histidine triad (HIT) family protein
MDDCSFCAIVRGQRDAYRLYEDDRTVAFLDGDPAVRGHTLVAPRDHHEYLFTDDASLSAAVFGTVRRVARAVTRALEADGVSTFYTTGDFVGHVTHAHVHVLPRHADDGIHLALDRSPLDDGDAETLAACVRERV